MPTPPLPCLLLAPLLGLVTLASAAQTNPPPAAAPADPVLLRGEGVEIRRSELDKAFIQFKANATVRGQTIPEARRTELEASLLDRLAITRLLLRKATEEDRIQGREQTDRFVSRLVQEAGSDSAYERQLLVLGFSREDFEREVFDRAVSETVVERLLRPEVKLTDEQVRAHFDANAEKYQRPEMFRAAHILQATRDTTTGAELPADAKAAKRAKLQTVLERVRKGEDFAALAKEFSEDPGSKDKGGEYLFKRGDMVAEFETAALALQTNALSDIVTTPFGYHIIKLLQRIPAEPLEFAKIQADLRDQMVRETMQEKLLPDFTRKLKEAAKLEYLNGARPPESTASPAATAFPKDAPPGKTP